MGGDFAPGEICLGAMVACSKYPDLEVILVGNGSLIEKAIEGAEPFVSKRIHVVHTDEYIAMNESPMVAFRKKKKASIRMAMEMVKSGDAQGCISAGNTGAVVAGGGLFLGRMTGVDRAGVGGALHPSQQGYGSFRRRGRSSGRNQQFFPNFHHWREPNEK